MMHAKAEVGKPHAAASHGQAGSTPTDQFHTSSIVVQRSAEGQLERMQTSTQALTESQVPAAGASSQTEQVTGQTSYPYESQFLSNVLRGGDVPAVPLYYMMRGTDAPADIFTGVELYDYR